MSHIIICDTGHMTYYYYIHVIWIKHHTLCMRKNADLHQKFSINTSAILDVGIITDY